MVSSKGQQDLPSGHQVLRPGTMMIKPLLFDGFRSNYLSVFNITLYLFDVGLQ